jgi:hypothetical protein
MRTSYLVLILLLVLGCTKETKKQPRFEWPTKETVQKVQPQPEGPIDTLKDAKKLIADMTAIMDQAKKDGEITVKIKIPVVKPEAEKKPISAPLKEQVVPPTNTTNKESVVVPNPPVPYAEEKKPEVAPTESGCANGRCSTSIRPRLFRRFR